MIATVTMNPALDRLVRAESLIIGDTNRVTRQADSPAGKGIDVAKALRSLGIDVTVTGFLGGDTAPAFIDFFAREGIRNDFVPIQGTTRTNIQIFGEDGKRTELLESGPEILPAECDALLQVVRRLADACRVITLNGSAPRGITVDYFRELIRTAKSGGAFVITDTSGKFLEAALQERPHLIKPNRLEMRELMGNPDAGNEEIIAYAQKIVQEAVPYVLVSLGRDGAILVCREGVWHGLAPDVPVKSTLGCGDTMVASMALSFEQGHTPDIMLKNAIALSTANVMTFETARIIPSDYEDILKITAVERIR